MLESLLLLIPWGKEVLLIGLTAQRPSWFLYYACVAAIGSASGCFLLDAFSRRSGRLLSRHLSERQAAFAEHHIRKHGALALSVAALMPPPFPFTAFLTTAGAFGYPRRKLLSTVALARFIRFTAVAAFAAYYQESILTAAASPAMRYTLLAVILAPLLWTGISVLRSRSRFGRSKSS